MSNKIYLVNNGRLQEGMEKPIRENFDNSLAGKADYHRAIDKYNSRPSYPIHPILKVKDGDRLEEGKDFEFKEFNSIPDSTGNSEYAHVAFPIPLSDSVNPSVDREKEDAIKDFSRAINALMLELPKDVWINFHFKWIQLQEVFKHKLPLSAPVQEPVQEDAPLWYDKQTMYEWLIQNKYSKQIAEELSEHWAKDLQGAFKKGWEKAKNDNHPDRKDYQYMPVQEDNQDELWDEVDDIIFGISWEKKMGRPINASSLKEQLKSKYTLTKKQ